MWEPNKMILNSDPFSSSYCVTVDLTLKSASFRVHAYSTVFISTSSLCVCVLTSKDTQIRHSDSLLHDKMGAKISTLRLID